MSPCAHNPMLESSERSSSSQLLSRRYCSIQGSRVLRLTVSRQHLLSGSATDQFGFAGGDALNGDGDEDEEQREDRETLCGARLGDVSDREVQGGVEARRTITPWSQAKIASSYNRVTRSQRAVM